MDSINEEAWKHLATDPRKAAALAQTAFHKASSIRYDRGRGDALTREGLAHQYLGEFDRSVHLLEQALELRLTTKDAELISSAYSNISLVHSINGDSPKSFAYLNKSLDWAAKTGNDSLYATKLHQVARLHLENSRLDSAVFYLNDALARFHKVADSMNVWLCRLDMAIVYYNMDLYDDAITLASNAAHFLQSTGETGRLTTCYRLLALCYEYTGHPQKADMYYRLAFSVADSVGYLDDMCGIAASYAQFLDSTGSPEANRWYALSLELKDSLYNSERTVEVAKWQARFDTREKERELAEVKLKKAESDAEALAQRQWVLALGTLLLALTGGTGFFVYRQRQREAQQKAKEEIRFRKQLLEASVNAQEEERQRIAKDLHDGLVQTLAAIKMGFQSLQRKAGFDKPLEEEFEARVKMVDAAADEARHISHQMMPRTLLESGLVPALDDMLQKTLALTDIKFRFEYFAIERLRFAKNIEVGLYRICQELVNNIIKHSGATEVDIQLYKTKTHLVLHVEDNGKGFQATTGAEKRGIGLSNIFSRASAVNGEVSYEEGRPSGTVANIRVPLDVK